MRFSTHNRTPRIKTNKSVKLMLAVGFGMIIALFLFMAVACSLYINSIMPAVVILVPVFVLVALIAITQRDMDKAYVEMIDDVIIVTDYYFGIKKEKNFLMCDISTAEIMAGYSMRVRGYRYGNVGVSYIVFRDNRGQYMFKILCSPETKQFFSMYLK